MLLWSSIGQNYMKYSLRIEKTNQCETHYLKVQIEADWFIFMKSKQKIVINPKKCMYTYMITRIIKNDSNMATSPLGIINGLTRFFTGWLYLSYSICNNFNTITYIMPIINIYNQFHNLDISMLNTLFIFPLENLKQYS